MEAYYQATINNKMVNVSNFTNSGIKLMEHSYIMDDYVLTIMETLLDNPQPLVWLCDYTEDSPYTDLTWDSVSEVAPKIPKNSKLTPANYYIINHTRNEYISILAIIMALGDEQWKIHPIPLLCNSEDTPMSGGGDYQVEDNRRATWCGDIISTSLTAPTSMTNVSTDCIFT